jgi:6-phosphogluconolactonase
MIAAAARAAAAESGAFTLALSGGSGPLPMYDALGAEDLPWRSARVLQVDERIAPEGHADRNLTALMRRLPPAAAERLEPMRVEDPDPEAAAVAYAGHLPEALDVVHLGLGPDGHTASLVPGDPVLEVTDRRVALTAGEYEGRRRMTLTYPCLAAARTVIWLVTGADKRDALERLLAGDPTIPAGRVDAPEAVIVADAAASE